MIGGLRPPTIETIVAIGVELAADTEKLARMNAAVVKYGDAAALLSDMSVRATAAQNLAAIVPGYGRTAQYAARASADVSQQHVQAKKGGLDVIEATQSIRENVEWLQAAPRVDEALIEARAMRSADLAAYVPGLGSHQRLANVIREHAAPLGAQIERSGRKKTVADPLRLAMSLQGPWAGVGMLADIPAGAMSDAIVKHAAKVQKWIEHQLVVVHTAALTESQAPLAPIRTIHGGLTNLADMLEVQPKLDAALAQAQRSVDSLIATPPGQ